MKHLSLSLNHGVMAALVNFGLVMAIYLIDINFMVAWWFSLMALTIVPVFMFLSGTAVECTLDVGPLHGHRPRIARNLDGSCGGKDRGHDGDLRRSCGHRGGASG